MPLVLNGATSGSVTLSAPAVAGSTSLELPTDSIKPALVLIAASTFSSTSSVSLNNCFTSTYDNYRFVYNITAFSATTDYILGRLRSSGTDNSSVEYYAPRVLGNGSTVTSDNATANGFVVGVGSSAYPTAPHGEFDLIRPNIAEFTKISSMSSYLSTGGVPSCYSVAGCHVNATAYDGFTLAAASGTFSGTIRVYGYRNSL